MAEYLRTEVFNSQGKRIWSGDYHKRYEAIKQIKDSEQTVALGYILGCHYRLDKTKKYSSKTIFKKAIEWGYLNIDNNLPGFVTVLPKTKILERLVEKINAEHFKELNAVEITFPTFFNYTSKEIKELTKSYEIEKRMFRLGESDQEARISYAADPGLLLWLKNKIFKNDSLPYAIYTQTQVFRRFKGGEISGFPQLREFPMPDLHILCKKENAVELYLKNLSIAAKNMRFLLEEEWAFCLDITPKLYDQLDDFIINLCKTINKISIVNILRNKPRYYDMKSVFMMDAGDCAIMNFNMQWDQENSKLFNITDEFRNPLVILHGTLMHSWYKILPVFINKMLVDDTLQTFPYHVAPLQVSIIPINHNFINLANTLREDLISQNIRCVLIKNNSISKAIQISNKNQIPYFIMVGEKELENHKFNITEAKTKITIDLQEFIKNKNDINKKTQILFLSEFNINSIFGKISTISNNKK
jgi:threonyl-tRNA synthetase